VPGRGSQVALPDRGRCLGGSVEPAGGWHEREDIGYVVAGFVMPAGCGLVMTGTRRRRPAPDRARKRAIRAHAAQTGVSYSVAARLLDHGGAEPSAALGRTVYPPGTDEHRQWLVELWQRRPFSRRVSDAQQAIRLPLGRAEHLILRFPSTRGEPGTGVGPLYDGACRRAVLALLYLTVRHEQPDGGPTRDELGWLAELGEDTVVDLALAPVDRAARRLLDLDRWRLWRRIESALDAAGPHHDVARALRADLRSLSLLSSVDGARHTLDALLVASQGGHAPGTRVRLRGRGRRGWPGTIVAARWCAAGAPVGYDVVPDAEPSTVAAVPTELTLLPHPGMDGPRQEADHRAEAGSPG
jgi:hypothetical protein